MRNVTNLLLIFFALVLGFSACQTQAPMPSAVSSRQPELQHHPVSPDDFIAFHDTLIFGRVTHTQDSFQVQLTISSPQMMMRLLRLGLTVWLDSTAQQKQQVGVIFPSAGLSLARRHPADPRRPDEQQIMRENNPVRLIEIVKSRQKVFTFGDESRFVEEGEMAEVFLDEQGDLNYIVVLPFSMFGIKDPSRATIGIGVFSDLPETPATHAPARGQPGYGYPRTVDRQPPRNHLTRPINNWIKFSFE
jgi:hypothetical protein